MEKRNEKSRLKKQDFIYLFYIFIDYIYIVHQKKSEYKKFLPIKMFSTVFMQTGRYYLVGVFDLNSSHPSPH